MSVLSQKITAIGLTTCILASCAGAQSGSSVTSTTTESVTSTTVDSVEVFRQTLEKDEVIFRQQLFDGAYFPTTETVGDLLSIRGLSSQVEEGESGGFGWSRQVCDSLNIEDLVALASPSKAKSINYQHSNLDDSEFGLIFFAEVVAFDVPRDQSLKSLVRSATDSVASGGGKCLATSRLWGRDTCPVEQRKLSADAIPGWFQESDFVASGCERVKNVRQEFTTTVDRVPDLYFPNQFFIAQIFTDKSIFRWVKVFWFLPAEWLGVMFYVEASLSVNASKPFAAAAPSATEVIDAAAAAHKAFKDQFVRGLSESTGLPGYEDLFVRRSVVGTQD